MWVVYCAGKLCGFYFIVTFVAHQLGPGILLLLVLCLFLGGVSFASASNRLIRKKGHCVFLVLIGAVMDCKAERVFAILVYFQCSLQRKES